MKIINTMDKIYDIYSNESFDINKWKDYINNINPKIKKLCIQDMNEALNTGQVNYQMDFLPILNDVIKNKEKLLILQNNFNTVLII